MNSGVIFLIFPLIISCDAWNTDELQMFDLMDELKISFYDFLGVEQTASSSEIRSAYRKLSVKLHPDKNVGDPAAADKFRQLASIYEVLKDDERRKSYDEVLENGMPDWKTTVFYYRKLRKMSNIELGILFVLLSTTIHYAALWGARFERSWTLEEQLSNHYKRHKARDRRREEIDELITTELRKIPRPKWHDLLPFAICKGVYSLILALLVLLHFAKVHVSEKIEEKRQTWRELEDKKVKTEVKERKRRNKVQPTDKSTPYDAETLNAFVSLADIPPETTREPISENVEKTSNREWSEEDVIELVHAVSRFPGGVAGRWERIAAQLNRTVSDVTKKAKELGERKLYAVYQKSQMSYEIPAFETNFNAVCGETSEEEEEGADESQLDFESKTDPETPYEEVEQADVIVDEPYMSRKKQKQQKLAVRKEVTECKPSENSSDGWTQVEQKQLEVAIRSISKTTAERWDRIADCVPTKTKAEVMQRVKYLSTLAKSKATQRLPRKKRMSELACVFGYRFL
ncbi:DnaJ domain protein, partial [Opisthorchis viverrini]